MSFAIEKLGTNLTVTGSQGTRETIPPPPKYLPIGKYSSDKQENLNFIFENCPIDDRIPTERSLAKKNFYKIFNNKESSGSIVFENSAGDKVQMIKVGTGEISNTYWSYVKENGNGVTIMYDSDGNAIKGLTRTMDILEESCYEEIEFDFDIYGKPIIRNISYYYTK